MPKFHIGASLPTRTVELTRLIPLPTKTGKKGKALSLKKIIKMNTKEFVYWQDDNVWIGYLMEYPDYWTQGETFDELKENLKDIFNEIVSGTIPNIRKTGELEIA